VSCPIKACGLNPELLAKKPYYCRIILKISKGLRNTMPVENLTNTGEYPNGYSLAS